MLSKYFTDQNSAAKFTIERYSYFYWMIFIECVLLWLWRARHLRYYCWFEIIYFIIYCKKMYKQWYKDNFEHGEKIVFWESRKRLKIACLTYLSRPFWLKKYNFLIFYTFQIFIRPSGPFWLNNKEIKILLETLYDACNQNYWVFKTFF